MACTKLILSIDGMPDDPAEMTEEDRAEFGALIVGLDELVKTTMPGKVATNLVTFDQEATWPTKTVGVD